MSSRRVWAALFLAIALPPTAVSCADVDCHSVLCTASTSTTPSGEAGPDSGTTDPCVANPDAPACLDESAALFVSASGGADTGPGTKAKPFKTVTAALGAITAAKRRIYICDGTYAEDLSLGPTHNGVSLLGGRACADWASNGSKPKLGVGNMPLKVQGATGVAIADLAVEAANGTPASTSSIAAWVRSADVTFARVSLSAGEGAKGDPGTLTPYVYPPAAGLNGNDGANGGDAKKVTCPDGSVTQGGKGGPNGFDGESGTPGPDNNGAGSTCAGPGTGGNGQPGTSAAAAPGATVSGQLGDDGWQPQRGGDGLAGGPGQGGGGGYGSGGGTGGSGGAGGCGGAGSTGGKGGGASIALASNAATVHFSNSSLATKNAGAGGSGLSGQLGQSPGGFKGNGSATSCPGGNGGKGGDGGTGGGGAGGISVGVVYSGTAPVLDAATTSAITTGTKGTGGKGPGNAGIDGVSQATLEIK